MFYLITGGCGFLGANLAAFGIRRGDRVAVFDNLSRVGASSNLAWLRSIGPFEFVHGDVRNSFDVESAVRKFAPKAIFHVAGQVAMSTSLASPRTDFEINVVGTLNVLEAVRNYCPAAAVVYSSSNKVYGDLRHATLEELDTRYQPRDFPLGIDESAPLEFHTPYGCSKGAADQYMQDYCRCFGLRTVVFRHSTIYGGRQFSTYDQGWVGWFCRQALEARAHPDRAPFTICGDGKQVRDLLHASDVVQAYHAAVDRIDIARGQAFNLGGGADNSMSLLELFAFLERELPVNLKYTKLPWRQSDQKFFVADIRKARRLLEWQPRISKLEGIKEMLSWEASAERAQ